MWGGYLEHSEGAQYQGDIVSAMGDILSIMEDTMIHLGIS